MHVAAPGAAATKSALAVPPWFRTDGLAVETAPGGWRQWATPARARKGAPGSATQARCPFGPWFLLHPCGSQAPFAHAPAPVFHRPPARWSARMGYFSCSSPPQLYPD